tara:strand:- start:1014 stop:1340 length:327 start_codon:yes stop_codon:yes gene_type:complete
MEEKTKTIYMWFIVLSILDILTTYIALTYFNGYEGNPIARWFMYQFGLLSGMLILKNIGVVCMYFLFKRMEKVVKIEWKKNIVFGMVLGLSALIVLINSFQIVWVMLK